MIFTGNEAKWVTGNNCNLNLDLRVSEQLSGQSLSVLSFQVMHDGFDAKIIAYED